MATLLEKIDASAAARLSLPPNHQPAQELMRYKNFLKVETHRLKILHRGGAGGLEISRARAAILDVLLRYILEGVQKNTPDIIKSPPRFALVAIGGYGRAELNPHSDIDIMFLHDIEMTARAKASSPVASLVDGLLYTLWDIGLKVGHSVRNLEDCVRAANSNMQSKTSLLEARLLMGDESLFIRFQSTLIAKCILGFEEEYINARLEDQTARRLKFGNSSTMQEPNIKNGCGGLRDYQNLIWMTYFKYRTHSIEELEQKKMISESERKQLQNAYDFLLRVRNELHYHLNRAVDILTKSEQPAVAQNLGYPQTASGQRLEIFMGDYYSHSRNIDLITRTVEQRLALVPQKKFSFRRILRDQRERARQQILDGFKFLDGEIHPVSDRVFQEHPRRLMRVFLYAQQRDYKFHPDLAQLIRNSLKKVDNSFIRDSHVRETFLEILDQRGNVSGILRAMHEVGFLGKFLPEFGKLTCLVQHEFYHQYTADEHTLVCLEKLDQVWHAQTPPFNGYTEIFARVERPFVLYLALLLHDSGKAYRTGKHEDVGGQLALRVARRLALDGATTHTFRLIIENHLLMAQVSQRRDLDEESVITQFAQQVQSLENLHILTLHTLADSLGTSDQLWNSFKDTLLLTLYEKTREKLSGGTDFLRAQEKHREILADEVEQIMPSSFSTEELQAHFDHVPPRYFQIHTAKEIVGDLALVHRFMHHQISDEDEALLPVIHWHHEPDRGFSACNICTWDRAGLFSIITGCLSASGLNILSAEILTRTDGVVLDTFYVTDAVTGHLAKREEKETFEKLLAKNLVDNPEDLSSLIATTKRASSTYKSLPGEKIPTVISFHNEPSQSRTIIDLETEDRVGLLYSISNALNALNVDVSLAKIITEKGAAVDSFYVADSDGNKILDPARQKVIEQKLREAIEQVG